MRVEDRIEMSSGLARLRWGSALRLAESGTHVIVKRYSQAVAVMISFADYEAVKEELEALRVRRLMAEIANGVRGD